MIYHHAVMPTFWPVFVRELSEKEMILCDRMREGMREPENGGYDLTLRRRLASVMLDYTETVIEALKRTYINPTAMIEDQRRQMYLMIFHKDHPINLATIVQHITRVIDHVNTFVHEVYKRNALGLA